MRLPHSSLMNDSQPKRIDRYPILRSLRSVAGACLEAILWTAGFLFAQGVILSLFLAAMILSSFGFTWPDQQEIITWILATDLDRSFMLIGVPVLGAIFVVLPAIRFFEGPDFRNRIGWRLPTSDETVYALAMVVPVSLIGNVIYDVTNAWWNGDRVVWPFAMALRESSLDQIYKTFSGVPYPVLVVAMALAPAVVEELVFRGMLGRRLVRRLGVIWGIGISSILFAAVHGSPPHAVATIPIAVLLHVVYLQTGTIWVPILLHFCNNLLAISLVRFQLGPDTPVSLTFLLTLCVYLMVMLFLLHRRTRHRSQTLGTVNLI